MLRYCDSFDHYATADVLLKWSAQNNAAIVAGVGRTGAALGLSSDSAYYVTRTLDNQGTWTIGFAFKTQNLYPFTFPLLVLMDGATTQVDLRITTTGFFQVTRNGTQLAIDSTTVATGTWMYLELKAVIHGSTGSFEFKLNGTTVLSGSSVNTSATGNAYANAFQLRGTTNGTQYIDDLYALDGTGSTNTTFLGDVTVRAILPDGAGNYSQFTPSAGSNYQNVDDTAPDEDATYNASMTVGHKDTYTFGAVGVTGLVYGVQAAYTARKDDAGTRTVRDLVRISSTDYNGSTQTLGDSYQMFRQTYDVSPASSSAWTIAEIDAAEFGIEVVS